MGCRQRGRGGWAVGRSTAGRTAADGRTNTPDRRRGRVRPWSPLHCNKTSRKTDNIVAGSGLAGRRCRHHRRHAIPISAVLVHRERVKERKDTENVGTVNAWLRCLCVIHLCMGLPSVAYVLYIYIHGSSFGAYVLYIYIHGSSFGGLCIIHMSSFASATAG